MKTPEGIVDELFTAWEARPEYIDGPSSLTDEDLRIWMVDAIEADRKQRTEYATAQHWEVSRESDEAGEWVYLEIHRDDPEDEGLPPIVNVSLSEYEAHDLAERLALTRWHYAFAPEGEPDRFRDLWNENMPRVSGRMYFAIPGEQPLHVTDEQAHYIMTYLSEENR